MKDDRILNVAAEKINVSNNFVLQFSQGFSVDYEKLFWYCYQVSKFQYSATKRRFGTKQVQETYFENGFRKKRVP